MLAVQIRRADLDGAHAEFARQEPRERNLTLAVGEEEDALPIQARPVTGERRVGAGLARLRHGADLRLGRTPDFGRRAQPARRSLRAQREGCRNPRGTAGLQQPGGVAQEGLREQVARTRPDRRQIRRTAARQEPHRTHAERREMPQHLVLDDLCQGTDDKE